MVPAGEGSGIFRFSTDKLPVAERGRVVRGLYERKLFPVKLVPMPEEEVRLSVTWKFLSGLRVLSGFYSGLHTEGVRESTGNEDLTLIVSLGGTSVFCQRGQRIKIEPHVAVVTTREFGSFTCTGVQSGRCLGLRIPRTDIAPLVPDIGDAIRRLTVHNVHGGLALLAKFADAIVQDRTASPEFDQLIATQVYDIAAMVLGAGGDTGALARTRGVRAARLRIIKMDIVANLGDCHLKPAAVARRQGVTPRYVHKLFEGEGTSFSEFVLGQRLERAYRNYADPRFHHRLISSVAYEAGFGDLSHFNHCFRRRYGVTPSDVRAQLRGRYLDSHPLKPGESVRSQVLK